MAVNNNNNNNVNSQSWTTAPTIAGPVPTTPAGQQALARATGNDLVERAYQQQQASGVQRPAAQPGALEASIQVSEDRNTATNAMTNMHASAAFQFAIPDDPQARAELAARVGGGVASAMGSFQDPQSQYEDPSATSQPSQSDAAGQAQGASPSAPSQTSQGGAAGAATSSADTQPADGSTAALQGAYTQFYNSLGSGSNDQIREAGAALRHQAVQSLASGPHTLQQTQATEAAKNDFNRNLSNASAGDTQSLQRLLVSANNLLGTATPPGTLRQPDGTS